MLFRSQILPWRDGEFGKNVNVVKTLVSCAGCYSRQTPPVRVLTCENPQQWSCNKSFDFLEITNALDMILKKTITDPLVVFSDE
mgnify:CR=1 FL=1